MPRREFPKTVKRDAFVRAAGHCEQCSAKLSVGKFAYDHINPDGLTGEPTLENCMVLCAPCHDEKTKRDIKHIAKAKRRSDDHLGIKRPAILKGQGFRKYAPTRRATTPVSKLTLGYQRRPTP